MLIFSRLQSAIIIGLCLLGVLLAVPTFLNPGTLPEWVPQPRVHLGLDLQGGSYLLLEVDRDAVIRERNNQTRETVAVKLRDANIRRTSLTSTQNNITVTLASASDMEHARTVLADILSARSGGPTSPLLYTFHVDGPRLTLSLSEAGVTNIVNEAASQSIAVVRRRIDATGLNEPLVAQQGVGRILVELPGVSDPTRIKRLLGSTARLTFRMVDTRGVASSEDVERLPLGEHGGSPSQLIPVLKHVEVDGADLTGASPVQDRNGGGWAVSFSLNASGGRRFADVTTHHVGQPFAIVLDNKVISAPVIREPIVGGRGEISGSFTLQDATDLAVLLRAGALPAPLTVVEERSVGPSLGADAIHAGLLSVLLGLVLVIAYMIVTYGRFGIYTAGALIANLGLTLAALALLDASLTLPGIAGLLLALGMAVDSNILIFERIREETRTGKGVISSIEAGFKRALTTITDANVTTLLKMLILLSIGVGAIKGFANTISIGIVVSMFTALILVRLMMARWYRRTMPKTLTVGTRFHIFPEGTHIAFMRARYSGLIVSALISLASIGLLFYPGLRLGVDFAGGIVVEVQTQGPADLAKFRSDLSGAGLGPVQVQQFGRPQDVLLRFELPDGNSKAQAQTIDRAREAVQKVAPEAEIRRVEAVGASIGSELLRSGVEALALAALIMFAYITFRFEWPFAVGAIATMFLDLTKTLGFFAITGFEFNLTSIAAGLTIMGFSINDKIVVYDRVRENLKRFRSTPLREVIDRSINETLSRTVGTSIALFLAIVPLAIFGGPALQEFALTLLFGLVLATSSSIFIAAPILLNLGERWLGARAATKKPVAAQPIPKAS